jgi:hypothetical protein
MFRHVPGEDGRDKPLDLFDPRDRIGKLIRLLASDKDGEAMGAVRALDRVLTGFGGFHHLADLIDLIEAPPAPEPIKHPWQILAAELLKHPGVLLGSRDHSFLRNMARARTAPTPAQQKWLGDIEARLSAARMAS